MKNISDIIAYYLSEFDMRAFEELGYSTRTEGFKELGEIIGKKANYIKRLRDEYDVVTSSVRNGQKNRPPRQRIIEVAEYMSDFTFEEITSMIKMVLWNTMDDPHDAEVTEYEASEMDEEVVEKIINAKDKTASIKLVDGKKTVRVYNNSIISQIKRLYKGKCQICGEKALNDFDADICEVHHISYFSQSMNNDADNLIVLCPNHHRLIHKLNPAYDADNKEFVFNTGKKLSVILNYHL